MLVSELTNNSVHKVYKYKFKVIFKQHHWTFQAVIFKKEFVSSTKHSRQDKKNLTERLIPGKTPIQVISAGVKDTAP